MKKLVLIIALFLAGCPVSTDPLRPAPIEPKDTDWCEAGCKYLDSLPGQDGNLGCLESRPLQLPDGGMVSCKQFCEETQRKGRALSPKCWVEKVKKCEDIEPVCRHNE